MTMTTTETVASSLADRKATFVRSYCEGDVAAMAALYTADARHHEGREVDNGKFLVVWRLEAGAWRTLRDIWNSNVDAWGGDRS